MVDGSNATHWDMCGGQAYAWRLGMCNDRALLTSYVVQSISGESYPDGWTFYQLLTDAQGGTSNVIYESEQDTAHVTYTEGVCADVPAAQSSEFEDCKKTYEGDAVTGSCNQACKNGYAAAGMTKADYCDDKLYKTYEDASGNKLGYFCAWDPNHGANGKCKTADNSLFIANNCATLADEHGW